MSVAALSSSGYLALRSLNVAVPPKIIGAESSAAAGEDVSLVVFGSPKQTESIELKLEGAGLSTARQLAPFDFGNRCTNRCLRSPRSAS